MKSTVDVETFSFHSVASSDVFERAIFRYGLAVFSVVIALGIKLLLLHFNFAYPLSTSFLLAIAITFWYAGTAPGILSVLLSFVAFALFVLPYQVDYRIVLPDGSGLARRDAERSNRLAKRAAIWKPRLKNAPPN